jgi:hypothetical protein
MVNPVEMASPEAHVAEQLKGIPGYRDPFAKPFRASRIRSRSPMSRKRSPFSRPR